MKYLKGLLNLVITFFAVVIGFIIYPSSASMMSFIWIGIIYLSLIYHVWLLGRPQQRHAFRWFIVLVGFGIIWFAFDMFLKESCPAFFYAYKSAIFAFIIDSVCLGLGTAYAAFFLLVAGCYILYFSLFKM